MANVEWTSRARRSLSQIHNYIARVAARPQAADGVVRRIHTKSESYGRQPSMGSLHEDLPDGYRFFVHKRYVIVYEELEDGIIVQLVVDSARDWARLFGDEGGSD